MCRFLININRRQDWVRSRTFVRTVAGVCLMLLAVAPPPLGADVLPDVQQRLLDSVKYLASDELEGRGVGTKGLNDAADFVRDQFAQAGLDVTAVNGGAFQTFEMVSRSELGPNNRLELEGPHGEHYPLIIDKDFRTCAFGGSREFDAELVFCGYGIDDSDLDYNDFKDLDVKGKAVVIMRRVPQQENPHSPFSGPHGGISRHGDLRAKVSTASALGAAAVLFVNDPYSVRKEKTRATDQLAKAKDLVVDAAREFLDMKPVPTDPVEAAKEKLAKAVERMDRMSEHGTPTQGDQLMEFGYGGDDSGWELPVLHLTQESLNDVLRSSLGKTLEEIEAEIDSDLKPRSAVLTGWAATGHTDVKRITSDVKNVIGVLEGDGPLADETIVIGAHYDHLGRGERDSLTPGSHEIHNGADDNASGTAALIELARYFVEQKQKPRRRLVFIAFTGEEMGLIGSAHYVKEPLFPLEQTIAMFNMDMVGRLRDQKLTVFGTGTAPRWTDLLKQKAESHGFELIMKPDGFGPSDHSSFYGKKIPVLHFFTGAHEDYHRPSDDWEKVNVAGMGEVIELIAELVANTSQTSERPQYTEVKSSTNELRSGSRPYFGSIPDFGTSEPGYSLSGVASGSPADLGGLVAGDRIIKLGKYKIDNLEDFDLALRRFSAGDTVDVVVNRDGQDVTAKVTLEEPR